MGTFLLLFCWQSAGWRKQPGFKNTSITRPAVFGNGICKVTLSCCIVDFWKARVAAHVAVCIMPPSYSLPTGSLWLQKVQIFSGNGDDLGPKLLKPHHLRCPDKKINHINLMCFFWLFIKNELKSLTAAKMWSKDVSIFHCKDWNMMQCLVKHSFYFINMHQNCGWFIPEPKLGKFSPLDLNVKLEQHQW